MPGILVVPAWHNPHWAAILHVLLSHLKELLHHQPSKVVATLASQNAGEGRFFHQCLNHMVQSLTLVTAAGNAAPLSTGRESVAWEAALADILGQHPLAALYTIMPVTGEQVLPVASRRLQPQALKDSNLHDMQRSALQGTQQRLVSHPQLRSSVSTRTKQQAQMALSLS